MKLSFTLRDAARLITGWDPEEKVTSETAWLNGVRGLAAFLVMMGHYSWDYLSFTSDAPFGAVMLVDSLMNSAVPLRKDSRLWDFWRFPIVHMFVSGAGGQVALFFVISGFVLTWSSFGHIQSENHSKLYTSLSSSVFRRWSRLFLPCVAATYLYALQQDLSENKNLLVGLWNYLKDAVDWINPFRSQWDNTVSAFQIRNNVVWTIPYEFSGSIYVFIMVLILGRFRFSHRLLISVSLTLGAFFANKSYLWLFGSGMVLADYARHTQVFKQDRSRTSVWRTIIWTFVFVFGLFCVGWPKRFHEAYARPGYDWFDNMPLPKDFGGADNFFHGFGAILTIAGACHLRLVRRFYETAFLQYLGKLSFMLYLIHILVGGEVGRKILHSTYKNVCTYDDEKVSGMDVCHINGFLHWVLIVGVYSINIACVFVVANILERLVDRPITNLGRIVDNLFMRNWKSETELPPVAEPEGRRLLDSISLDEMERGEAEPKDLESEVSSFKDSEASSIAESQPRHGG